MRTIRRCRKRENSERTQQKSGSLGAECAAQCENRSAQQPCRAEQEHSRAERSLRSPASACDCHHAQRSGHPKQYSYRIGQSFCSKRRACAQKRSDYNAFPPNRQSSEPQRQQEHCAIKQHVHQENLSFRHGVHYNNGAYIFLSLIHAKKCDFSRPFDTIGAVLRNDWEDDWENDWGFAPNPTRELSSLDPDYAVALRQLFFGEISDLRCKPRLRGEHTGF